MNLLLATRNKDKIKEIKEILKDLDIEIISAYDIPGMPDVIEDRETIKGNAIKKAIECAVFSGMLTLADDTGLFVDALDGKPGVHAARFAGENCTYKDNRDKMLREMEGKTNRKAQFRTVVAFASLEELIETAQGKIDGTITESEIGTGGFGYDPIFRADETGKTFGEMSEKEKNKISHRGRAFRNMIPVIVTHTSGLRKVSKTEL
jgi:XTP/dITP diphosphohydrolase